MLCATCSSEIPLPLHPLQSKEDTLRSLREAVLSSSDIPDIRKNISDAQDILKAYDKKIRHLERTLAVFRSMASHLTERIEETSFLLSPIRQLPDEILAEVFKMSMPLGSVFSCTKRPSPSFLTVCVRWRTVALSTPSIWQSITLDYSRRNRFFHRHTTALDHHLSNLSKSSPLNIRISKLGPLESCCTQIVSAHFNSIAEQSFRWVSLSVESYSGSLTAQIERFNTIENFPNLRSLHLLGVISSSTISSILERSPVMTHLAITSFPDVDEARPFRALSNITHLELQCGRDPTVSNVLNICPKLISVMFCLFYIGNLSKEQVAPLCSHPPRHIPSIKDITFKVQEIQGEPDYDLLPSLLSSLHLPSLTSMTLDLTAVKTPFRRHDAFEALGDFFKKSHALTSLTLDSLVINDEDTVFLLRLVPSLTKLTIHERISKVDNADLQPITRRFLQCLSSYNLDRIAQTTLTARRLILPKLERLSLTVSGKTFLAEDQDLVKLFVNVVLSRWFPRGDLKQDYGVESLKYVKLCVVNGSVDRDIWDRLECLDGMVAILEDSEGPCK